MITALSIQSLALQRGERVLFSGLDFALAAGEAAIVRGLNGAGKTSLLRCVAGLLAPLAGAIDFLAASGRLDPAEARRAHCHLVGHIDALDGSRSARSELLFQVRWTGGSSEAALEAAQGLGLERILGLEVRNLSAGQRRRLALARLIASPRSLWLLDEPFASLDGPGRLALESAMASHLASGGLVLAATHDPIKGAGRTLEIGA